MTSRLGGGDPRTLRRQFRDQGYYHHYHYSYYHDDYYYYYYCY